MISSRLHPQEVVLAAACAAQGQLSAEGSIGVERSLAKTSQRFSGAASAPDFFATYARTRSWPRL